MIALLALLTGSRPADPRWTAFIAKLDRRAARIRNAGLVAVARELGRVR